LLLVNDFHLFFWNPSSNFRFYFGVIAQCTGFDTIHLSWLAFRLNEKNRNMANLFLQSTSASLLLQIADKFDEKSIIFERYKIIDLKTFQWKTDIYNRKEKKHVDLIKFCFRFHLYMCI
jgi:hypothetical protein